MVHAFDAPPKYTSFTEPIPKEGEVVVDVIAAGLHPTVKALANGSHYASAGTLPFIPGVDGVGRQEDGKPVYLGMSRPPFGTFSERALAARGMCIPVPEDLDLVIIAGIANPGMSSQVALTKRARFAAGESVLILDAAGVAGQLAVQIAKRLGAKRIIAVGRNPATLEQLGTLGADAIVPLDQEHNSFVSSIGRECGTDGIDVVIDHLWGPPAQAVLEAISKKALQQAPSRVRFIQVGESAGKTVFAISCELAQLRHRASRKRVWRCIDTRDLQCAGGLLSVCSAMVAEDQHKASSAARRGSALEFS